MFANEQEATMRPVTATLLNIVVKPLGCSMNRYEVPYQLNSQARKVRESLMRKEPSAVTLPQATYTYVRRNQRAATPCSSACCNSS